MPGGGGGTREQERAQAGIQGSGHVCRGLREAATRTQLGNAALNPQPTTLNRTSSGASLAPRLSTRSPATPQPSPLNLTLAQQPHLLGAVAGALAAPAALLLLLFLPPPSSFVLLPPPSPSFPFPSSSSTSTRIGVQSQRPRTTEKNRKKRGPRARRDTPASLRPGKFPSSLLAPSSAACRAPPTSPKSGTSKRRGVREPKRCAGARSCCDQQIP